MKNTLIAIFILILLMIINNIICEKRFRVEIAGEPPAKSIVLNEHGVTVKPLESAKLSDFIDTTFFGLFFPNINFEIAKMFFGNPNNIRNEDDCQFYEYWYDNFRIEIKRNEYSDEGGFKVDWTLYSYPLNKTFTEVLTPLISKHIDRKKENNTVCILNSKGEIQIFVDIIKNRVNYIVWYK